METFRTRGARRSRSCGWIAVGMALFAGAASGRASGANESPPARPPLFVRDGQPYSGPWQVTLARGQAFRDLTMQAGLTLTSVWWAPAGLTFGTLAYRDGRPFEGVEVRGVDPGSPPVAYDQMEWRGGEGVRFTERYLDGSTAREIEYRKGETTREIAFAAYGRSGATLDYQGGRPFHGKRFTPDLRTGGIHTEQEYERGRVTRQVMWAGTHPESETVFDATGMRRSRNWHPNGRLAMEMGYQSGRPVAITYFSPEGAPAGVLAYRGEWPWEGRGAAYDHNGQKTKAYEYQRGVVVSLQAWEADGSPKPATPPPNWRAVAGLTLVELVPEVEPARLEKEIATWTETCQNNPKRASYHRILGHLLVQAKRLDEALQPFQESLYVDPWNLSAYRAIARLYLALKRPQDAVTTAAMGLDVSPEDADLKRLRDEARAALPAR